MASICSSSPPLLVRTNTVSPRSLFSISFSAPPLVRFRALRAEGLDRGGGPKSQEAGDPALLRKPSISSSTGFSQISDVDEEPAAGDGVKKDDEWVDWEDQILEETVPLVGFVRMILHSGKYFRAKRGADMGAYQLMLAVLASIVLFFGGTICTPNVGWNANLSIMKDYMSVVLRGLQHLQKKRPDPVPFLSTDVNGIRDDKNMRVVIDSVQRMRKQFWKGYFHIIRSSRKR